MRLVLFAILLATAVSCRPDPYAQLDPRLPWLVECRAVPLRYGISH